jgi:hypothetical protein
MNQPLPPTCERALLEQFLRAESMAWSAVRSAQTRGVPPRVLEFLRRHEKEEAEHLRRFEILLERPPRTMMTLPRMPSQWWALAVQLLGYESLGLEFATLLIQVRPDLIAILEDERVHVAFFEGEVKRLLAQDETTAQRTREAAQAWRRRLPSTVDRYLRDDSFAPFRQELRASMLDTIDARFAATGLLLSPVRGGAPREVYGLLTSPGGSEAPRSAGEAQGLGG